MKGYNLFDEFVLFPEFVEEGDLKFVSVECVSRLNLEVAAMSGSMAINTPAKGPVITLLVCLNCT